MAKTCDSRKYITPHHAKGLYAGVVSNTNGTTFSEWLQITQLTLRGLTAGVVFNSIFPEWLQIVLLTVLLTAVIINTFKKALKLWNSEQKEASRSKDAAGLRVPPRPTPDHNILGVRSPLGKLQSEACGLRKGTKDRLLSC